MHAEIVRLRPHSEDAKVKLLAIRDDLVASYRREFSAFVSCQLLRVSDTEEWLDLWFWESREAAEEALAQPEKTPLFAIWQDQVELVRFEWSEVLYSG